MTQNWKNKSSLLIFLAGVVITILIATSNVHGAESAPQYGWTETGLYYELMENQEYMIYGYSGTEPIVNIPAYINELPVTKVYEAFQEDEVVTEVIFPETVKEIDYRCFEQYPNLKKVDLGGITNIFVDWHGSYLFWDCPQLETLIFGEGANLKIEEEKSSSRSFNIIRHTQWSQLKHIKISKTMMQVPASFFYSSSLETIEVENGHPDFKSIDNILYSADGKTLIVCGTNYKNEHCVIPEGVTTISKYGFESCSNIKTLTIPSSVISIDDSAFWDTAMMLYVDKGSYAEQYAAKNKLDYLRYNEKGSLEIPVTEMTLNHTNAAMHVGDTIKLVAACGPAQAADKSVEWRSSDPKIAKVTSDGNVTAIESGNAEITVTALGGCDVTAKCGISITVKDEDQPKKLGAESQSSIESDKEQVKSNASKPKKVVLKKAKSIKRGTLKLTWKRDTKATGYQAVVATDKKFKKNKKTATIKKNKTVTKTFTKLKRGKTYFTKVRAYKKVGKKNVYGAYSKVKKAKVK